MPTPKISREQAAEAHRAVAEHGGVKSAAAALGMAHTTL